MGTKAGQRRKTARRAYKPKTYRSKAAAQAKAKAMKKKEIGAWGVVKGPLGWHVGRRSGDWHGWTLLGGGWLKEKGFK